MLSNYQRFFARARNISTSGFSTLPLTSPASQCLQRLNDTLNAPTTSVRSWVTPMPPTIDWSAVEVLHDLRTLHENKMTIPKHFIVYGYRVAANSKQSDVLLDLTRLAIDNYSFVPDEEIKDAIVMGLKHVINAKLYSVAFTIWDEARRSLPITHTDTRQVANFMHGRNTQPSTVDLPAYGDLAVLPFQKQCSIYRKHVDALFRTYYYAPSSSSVDNSSMVSHEVGIGALSTSNVPEQTISKLLNKCTTTLKEILRSGYPLRRESFPSQEHARKWRKGIEMHLRILVSSGRFDEALSCLSHLLPCYAQEKVVDPIPASIDGFMASISPDDVEALDAYRSSSSTMEAVDARSWAYDLLLQVLYLSGTIRFADRVDRTQVIQRQLDYAIQIAQLSQRFGLPTDARLVHSFLSSIELCFQKRHIRDGGYDDELAMYGPLVNSLRVWIEALPMVSMQQQAADILVRMLLVKANVQCALAASTTVDWCIMRFPVLPSTISALCVSIAPLLSRERIEMLDKRLNTWMTMHKPTYSVVGARILLLPGRLALLKHLHRDIDMVKLVFLHTQYPYTIPKTVFADTIATMCARTVHYKHDLAEVRRFYHGIGKMASWLYTHMTTRSSFQPWEAIRTILPLLGKAMELSQWHIAQMDVSLEAWRQFLRTHWLVKDKTVWTAEDELILTEACAGCCRAKVPDHAWNLVHEIQAAFPKTNVVTARVLAPFVHHHIQEGEMLKAEGIVTEHLVNKGVPFTSEIVDALVHAVLLHGERYDALELARDLYNQHRVKLSYRMFTTLLQSSQRKNDTFEVDRVVDYMSTQYDQRTANQAREEATRLPPQPERAVPDMDDSSAMKRRAEADFGWFLW